MVWATCMLSLYLAVTVSGVNVNTETEDYYYGNNGVSVECTCIGPPPALVIPPPLYPTPETYTPLITSLATDSAIASTPAIATNASPPNASITLASAKPTSNNQPPYTGSELPPADTQKQPGGCDSVCIGLICFFLICAITMPIIAVVYLKKKEKMCFEKQESPGGHIVFTPSNKRMPADSSVHVEMESKTNEFGTSPKHDDTNTMEKNTKITTQRQKSTDPLLQTERKNNLSEPDGKYEYKSSPENLSPIVNGETTDSPKKKKKKKKKKHKKHTAEGEDNPNLDTGNREAHSGNQRHVQTTGRHANDLPPVNHPHRVEPMEEHYRPLPIPPLQKSVDSSNPHV